MCEGSVSHHQGTEPQRQDWRFPVPGVSVPQWQDGVFAMPRHPAARLMEVPPQQGCYSRNSVIAFIAVGASTHLTKTLRTVGPSTQPPAGAGLYGDVIPQIHGKEFRAPRATICAASGFCNTLHAKRWGLSRRCYEATRSDLITSQLMPAQPCRQKSVAARGWLSWEDRWGYMSTPGTLSCATKCA